ncbi:unnamed protein product [Cuscuta campestris]|uniref:Uncharacterized protein n=1 Tax=Cuscuta campestris TaxID=132261 RepID=A0A484MQ23_9ASTE|nr:unnamed protein product [Cuscuta campestris]
MSISIERSKSFHIFATLISVALRRASQLQPNMAGGGSFIHRVLSYVINEVVVNGLANSPSFQRFAVRTSRKIEEVSKLAEQKKKEIMEQMNDASKKF